jgi:hypothetical protein
MRRFQLPGRKVSHIIRTDCYDSDFTVWSLCGIMYTSIYNRRIKPITDTNVLPCRTCNRLAKPGVNC